MTLSGNSRAGFSQCISLPAPVPFQYSGNLCSSREGLADTTQQPASGRGTETRENDTKRERERHKGRVRQGVMQNEIKSDKRCGELE